MWLDNMGFFVNEEHYINLMKKIHKDKFNSKLQDKYVELFRGVYNIKYYNSLFSAFYLKKLPEEISWEFKELSSDEKELKKFYISKTKVLSGAKLFVKNPDKLLTNECKEFLNYCKLRDEFISEKIRTKLQTFKYKCDELQLSKKATKVLDDLLNTPGVYFIFDKNKKLSYIGKSYSLGNRIFGSIKERDGYYFSYIKTSSKIDADIIEPYLIGMKKPPLNSEYITNDKPSFKLKIPKVSKIIKIHK